MAAAFVMPCGTRNCGDISYKIIRPMPVFAQVLPLVPMVEPMLNCRSSDPTFAWLLAGYEFQKKLERL